MHAIFQYTSLYANPCPLRNPQVEDDRVQLVSRDATSKLKIMFKHHNYEIIGHIIMNPREANRNRETSINHSERSRLQGHRHPHSLPSPARPLLD
jgi:hypothetical protein